MAVRSQRAHSPAHQWQSVPPAARGPVPRCGSCAETSRSCCRRGISPPCDTNGSTPAVAPSSNAWRGCAVPWRNESGRAAAERVFEILDSEDEPGLADGIELKAPIGGRVVYKNVKFNYGDGNETICEVDLNAEPGQTIALVGPTGAGKTTLINLLTRFYEYDSGEILIDDVNIKTLSKESLRRSIGYVTQESFLFNGTIRDNLLIANREASEDQIWEALKIANAYDFVKKLLNGLDTEVGERGVKLSVGEKQRVSIARALLRNPPILLLDEATASVDTETERLIQQALERLMKNRTSFVIAHRLSTVRGADYIYVLDSGAVVEEGSHEHLLSISGLYAELCRTSFLDEQE